MIKIISSPYKIKKTFFTSKLAAVIDKLNIQGSITVRLGSSQESQKLNQQFLQKDYPTDVLSFPIKEELPQGFYYGDIFICYPLAREQAATYNISIEEELLNLMIHGVLHLAGYDHEKDKGEMDNLQQQLLTELTKPEKKCLPGIDKHES
jgi:probable rRNA maturation factor